MRYLIPLVFLGFASCTVVGERYGEDGSVAGYQIQCGQSLPGACESRAAELCPNGYRRISKLITFTGWTLEVQCKGEAPAA